MSVNVWMVIGFSVLAANARASRRVAAAASKESLTGVVRVMVGEIIFILQQQRVSFLPNPANLVVIKVRFTAKSLEKFVN